MASSSTGTLVSSAQIVARQVSSAATITTRTRDRPDPTADPAETTIDDYDINTSTIVRTAVVSGVIVLVLTAAVLFFKVRPLRTPMRKYHILTPLLRSLRGSGTINACGDNRLYSSFYKMSSVPTPMRLRHGRTNRV